MNIVSSVEVDQILPALLRARQQFGALRKSGKNAFLKSKYVVLDDLIDAVDPALEAEGIILVQGIGKGEEPFHLTGIVNVNKVETVTTLGYASVSVTTRLWHAPSGQWIEATATGFFSEEKGISFVQAQGKVITYLRRYQLTALTGIATEDDTDAQPGQAPAAKAAPGKPTAAKSPFALEWLKVFNNDTVTAKKRFDEVLAERGVAWADLKDNTQALDAILADERVHQAGINEDALAEELAELAAQNTAGEEENG